MLFGNSNISIIIETNSFDYTTFKKIWAPILSTIKLEIHSVYFYVHNHNNFSPIIRNNHSIKKNQEAKEKMLKLANITWPRIIISDLPDNGYLPLMISSYTDEINPLRFICYIDARDIDRGKKNYRKHMADLIYTRPNKDSKHPLTKWIEKSHELHLADSSLGCVFGFKTKISINSDFLPKNYNSMNQKVQSNKVIEKVVGCDIVMVKEPIVRELLYYTKSSMDSPSPFLTLSLNNELKTRNSYSNLIRKKPIEKVDFYPFSKPKSDNSIETKPNAEFTCPYINSDLTKKVTLSVFIPCYKRNYFKRTFLMMSAQTFQPEYYLLVQNRFHVFLDYETELKYYFNEGALRPVYKVWMVNYNSFFILPNLITSLLNTDYVVRFDDDHIPTTQGMLDHITRTENIENRAGDVILGDRMSVLNIYVGNFNERKHFRIDCSNRHPDYVASPYVYSPRQMKLSGRLKPMFLAGGEDAHFGLSAAILCGTVSKQIPFVINDLSGDLNRHEIDSEIIHYKEKYVHVNGELIHAVYEYFVRIGLKPVCWRDFQLDPRDMINGSVYFHTSFF